MDPFKWLLRLFSRFKRPSLLIKICPTWRSSSSTQPLGDNDFILYGTNNSDRVTQSVVCCRRRGCNAFPRKPKWLPGLAGWCLWHCGPQISNNMHTQPHSLRPSICTWLRLLGLRSKKFMCCWLLFMVFVFVAKWKHMEAAVSLVSFLLLAVPNSVHHIHTERWHKYLAAPWDWLLFSLW